MKNPLMLLLLLVPLLTACASTGSGGGADPNTIGLWELQEVQDLTAYEAVRRLRPAWLRTRSRGGPLTEGAYGVAVHVDGSRQPSGVEFLELLSTEVVQEMQFLNSQDATTRFGTGYPNGVILVTTLR